MGPPTIPVRFTYAVARLVGVLIVALRPDIAHHVLNLLLGKG
jgi:hypothetical protein